jgi:hypothetical protein|tara:strand:+ start:19 stop:147 length:129 start_codon:yes stop_codon:yes gene_type:complete
MQLSLTMHQNTALIVETPSSYQTPSLAINIIRTIPFLETLQK